MIELGPGVRRGPGGAEAVAAVPGGHGRGAGPARAPTTTRATRSTRWSKTARRHQHGRAEHLRADAGPDRRRARRVRTSTTTRARRRPPRAACSRADPEARRTAATSARTTSRSRSRACRRSTPAAATTTSAGRRMGPAGGGRLHGEALPQAVGRDPAGLGPERRDRGPADLLRHGRQAPPRPTRGPQWKPGSEFKARRDGMLGK